ncbi:hypothetical protein [Aeromicrobium stalagmiti]|uniref:hypothetical protein n=1 Tax=Aeromicrobium stalagmiti TaxID=2738988 RepID=UPI0015682561|nr:hypothetical protein [Aeromicrobium stalagmiti]NRQ50862.1 hypothetical protein [Aeromicrobium stalagmiti]
MTTVDPQHGPQEPHHVARPADRRDEPVVEDDRVQEKRAHEKFGGLNLGAAFFGWIVAIGVAVLLTGIVGAILAGANSSIEVTWSDAERAAGTIGLSTAIVLLVVLALSYYAGGYVAGRMSRFDGARQGVGVWVLGLLVTVVAIVLGAVFGDEYDVLDRVDLPRIPLSTDEITGGAIVAGIAVVAVTLVAAILGGLVGHRYHHRVDRAARV